MNSKTRFVVMAVIWITMMFILNRILPKPQAAPVVEKPTLASVQKLEQKAGNDKKALGDVIKAYQEVAVASSGTEDAAKARLQIGIIQQTKLNNQYSAIDQYTTLMRDFPPKTSPEGREAGVRLREIDRENQNAPSYGAYLYKIIDSLVALTGRNPAYSYVVALLIITLAFKLVTTPLSHLQFKYMKEMQKIQPLVKQLQEQYKGDQQVLGQKTMELYKQHGVNPFSSCLPLLVQMPFLLLLYKMVRLYQVRFVDGTFLWIGSSITQHIPPYISVNFFGYHKIPLLAANLALPDLPLLVIYTISMIVSQKLTIVDPSQAEQQKMMAYMMPIMFAVMFMGFPSAFMLYWLFFNIVSTVQQYYILKPTSGAALPPSESMGGGTPVETVIPAKADSKAGKRKKKFDAPKSIGTALNS